MKWGGTPSCNAHIKYDVIIVKQNLLAWLNFYHFSFQPCFLYFFVLMVFSGHRVCLLSLRLGSSKGPSAGDVPLAAGGAGQPPGRHRHRPGAAGETDPRRRWTMTVFKQFIGSFFVFLCLAFIFPLLEGRVFADSHCPWVIVKLCFFWDFSLLFF